MHYPAAFKDGFLFDHEFTSGSGGYHTGVQKGTCARCSSNTCDDIFVTEAVEAWTALIESPSDQYGNFGTDVICKSFKSNGFRCFDESETICTPLKQNIPFQCTRNVEVPTATIFSLSVASAQAVFAVGGLVFVSLRKLEKHGKDTSTLVDDDLRILVRKLRAGQDELRMDFHNRQEELHGLRGGQSRHEELIQNLLEKAGDHQA